MNKLDRLLDHLKARQCDLIMEAAQYDMMPADSTLKRIAELENAIAAVEAVLLAHIAVAKFDDHLPLYRQAEIYARDGVDLATSTLLGWLGATAAAVMPLVDLLRREVIASSDAVAGRSSCGSS